MKARMERPGLGGMGRKLTTLRQARKLTQERFAAQLNVSKSAVCTWERGQYIPPIYLVCDICRFYGVSADYLLGLVENSC